MYEFIKKWQFKWKVKQFFKACKKGDTKKVQDFIATSYIPFWALWVDKNLCYGALLALKHRQRDVADILTDCLTQNNNLHHTIRYLMQNNNVVLLDFILEKKVSVLNLSKILEIAVNHSAKISFDLVLSKFVTVINADIAYLAFNCAAEDVLESDPDEPNKSYYLRELGKYGITPSNSFLKPEILTATYGEADSMEHWPEVLPLELNKLLLRRYLNAIGTTPMEYLSIVDEKNKPALLAIISSE